MPRETSLTQSVDKLYDTKLSPKELAFIYAGYAGILLRSKGTFVLFDPADLF